MHVVSFFSCFLIYHRYAKAVKARRARQKKRKQSKIGSKTDQAKIAEEAFQEARNAWHACQADLGAAELELEAAKSNLEIDPNDAAFKAATEVRSWFDSSRGSLLCGVMRLDPRLTRQAESAPHSSSWLNKSSILRKLPSVNHVSILKMLVRFTRRLK